MGNRQVSEGLEDIIRGMLRKDASKRFKIDDLKKHKWINEGYNALLTDDGANMLANYTDNELKLKGINVSTVLMAQKIAKKLSQNRRVSMP